MRKLITRLIYISLLLCSSLNIAQADTLNFDNLVKKAINNSFDLKIANADINISKANLKEAKADYYPAIKAGLYSEYIKDLANDDSNISYIGSTVANLPTKFQDYIAVNLNLICMISAQRDKKFLMPKRTLNQRLLPTGKV